MRSGPGAARTILLFHGISARPSKQPLMVRTFLNTLRYMELGQAARSLLLLRQLLPLHLLLWRLCGQPFRGFNAAPPAASASQRLRRSHCRLPPTLRARRSSPTPAAAATAAPAAAQRLIRAHPHAEQLRMALPRAPPDAKDGGCSGRKRQKCHAVR